MQLRGGRLPLRHPGVHLHLHNSELSPEAGRLQRPIQRHHQRWELLLRNLRTTQWNTTDFYINKSTNTGKEGTYTKILYTLVCLESLADPI